MSVDENPLLNPNSYNLPANRGKTIQPLNDDTSKNQPTGGATEAVSLIRDKLEKIYTKEPDAAQELAEAEAAGKHRSKHQQFMHELSTSGKSLADIQTAWHTYYSNLPNQEKHEVWQEFYAEHTRINANKPTSVVQHESTNKSHKKTRPRQSTVSEEKRTISDIKSDIIRKAVKPNTKKGKASHSLVFGLSMGVFVAFIMLFGFFNERFIAPLITPSKSVSNTPLLIDPGTTAVGTEPKVIIPKINVEIPIIFDEKSTEEAAVQNALEEGVIHYPTTSNPGETGNGAIFGHSSNNILNKGKYKFAFVLLRKLETGDVFYVEKDGKRFAYKVYKKTVVSPDQVEVLGVQDKPSTMSLITCDPPGTTINRLVVVGEQISPDPGQNVASTAQTTAFTAQDLPGNAPSLWSRLFGWLSS